MSFTIKLLSMVGIVCLGGIVYSNTFFCAFHFDDMPAVVGNFAIRHIYNLQDIWNCLPRRFILYLSLAFNYHVNGLDVFGYHLFNLVVHLVTAVLVWWFVLLTLSSPVMKGEKISSHADVMALLAGLIFVAHPIQTEAVTYIVQRAAVMAGLFYLASLCLYVRSRLDMKGTVPRGMKGTVPCSSRGQFPSWEFYYIGSLIAAIAAMFTKETAITLPLMIVLYEFSFLKTKAGMDWRRLVPFLLTIFIIPVTMLCTETGAVRLQQLYREPGISSMHYLLTQCRVMVTYIRLAFFPFNQNLDYDYPVYKSILQAPVFLSVLFLGTIFFFAKHLFLKYRLVSFSILWFFLTLLPESSLLPIRDVIYEHRLYLPLVGFCMFLVSGGYYLLGRNAIKMMLIPLMMAITCYSVLAYQRNKIWQDEFTLWNDTVEKSPNKARPHYNRGHSYDKQGDTIQAIADYDKAIELDPDYADAYYNRGLILAKQNKFQQAVEDFTKTIAIKSDYAGAYNNRGIIYARQGNYPKAISDFTQALAIDPDDAKIYCNLGNTYYDQGNLTQAVLDYNKAIELDPIDTQAVNNRAIVCNQSPLSCK